LKITDGLLDWVKMNNIGISAFDSICHKVLNEESEEEKNRNPVNSSEAALVPLWVIITACVGSVIFLIAFITLVILYMRRKTAVSEGKVYIEMKE